MPSHRGSRGLDAAAQRGAIRAGVRYAGSEAVWTSSIPKENRGLADFSGTKWRDYFGASVAQNFPIRNPIIAGMSLGVTMVEAAEYSGSRITVSFGLESGGEVFALRGHITSPQRFGPHAWIRQGAKLVAGWQDVVEELPHMVRGKIFAPWIAQMAGCA